MKLPDNDDIEDAIDRYGASLYAKDQPVLSGMAPGFREGVVFISREFLTYIEKYREAYGEDIFPTEDLSQFDPKVVTAVSGRMARFILDNIIRDLEGMK
jgi:hypothetical protein